MILLTGASGFVGQLMAAVLLAHHDNLQLFLPYRTHHTENDLTNQILERARDLNPKANLSRTRLIMKPVSNLLDLLEMEEGLRVVGIREIIHSAGSVSYDDEETLLSVNVELTKHLVSLAKKLDVKRFIYISTAFSCGFGRKLVYEDLHPEPTFDPTLYTKTKRQTENLIIKSGVPYVIMRPSIVIGDSKTGIYYGKPYGIYQLMHFAHKVGRGSRKDNLHVIAPNVKLQVIHQDHFQDAMEKVFRYAAAGTIVHLASVYSSLITSRELIDYWVQSYLKPTSIHYYDSLADFPMEDSRLDRKEKLFVEMTGVNNEIAGYDLEFDLTQLRKMYRGDENFPKVTYESLQKCIDWYMQKIA
ncbi:SDR family oxidoreductase [bacterium]|nr:SDR family oxidoreductase [bacterium]